MLQKILIIGPAWVGDMVMAQCLFKLLKSSRPSAVLHVLAPAWTFSLLKAMPEVHHAIPLPMGHGEFKLKERYALAKKIREEGYDEAIVLPNSFKSALIPWLARIPIRTGWRGEFRYGLLNDLRYLDKKRYPLMIEQYMALGLPKDDPLPSPYPYPSFQVSSGSQNEVLLKHQIALTGKPILGISAGAEFGYSKRWPLEYYAELATQKLADGWDIWLFGSTKDRPITDKIMQLTGGRCENIAGRTELAETIILLSLISGMVTNDSGLMHVAAALAKPIIAIYGSTSPAFTPPLSKTATVLKRKLRCQPCFERTCPLKHHRCMRDIKAQEVLNAMTSWSKI